MTQPSDTTNGTAEPLWMICRMSGNVSCAGKT